MSIKQLFAIGKGDLVFTAASTEVRCQNCDRPTWRGRVMYRGRVACLDPGCYRLMIEEVDGWTEILEGRSAA